MNLADVFTVLFIIVGFLIVFVGYWLAAAGLFPSFVERCAERVGRAPVPSVALGAATMIPQVVLGFVLSSKAPNGAGKILGLVIVGIAVLLALVGSAGVALRIGTGLKSARDEQEPWRRVLRGGVVLGLTFVLPFLGTFVILPGALLGGYGAFVLTAFQRRTKRVAVPEEAVIVSAPSSVS
jgi:hypothetical protein